jgi:hypothetical protein
MKIATMKIIVAQVIVNYIEVQSIYLKEILQ